MRQLVQLRDFLDTARPSLRARLIAGLVAGVIGALVIFAQYDRAPDFHTDFGVSWFGARSMLHGIDPYPLVGPGKKFDYGWPLVYPATSLVAIAPLGLLSERIAATVFVGLSTALLAFGLTSRGWYLLPLFATEAFMNGARLGQWNILLTAALFIPLLNVFSVVKPQASIPILSGSTSQRAIESALLGGLVLTFVSVLLIPGWVGEWWPLARGLTNMDPPITRFGGFLIPLVLLRWRRPEAWLVLVLASLPQNSAFYGTLPLFTIPANFIQAVVLAGIAAAGGNLGAMMLTKPESAADLYSFIGGLQVVTIYLPAVVLILLRRNEGEGPAWSRWLPAPTERPSSPNARRVSNAQSTRSAQFCYLRPLEPGRLVPV